MAFSVLPVSQPNFSQAMNGLSLGYGCPSVFLLVRHVCEELRTKFFGRDSTISYRSQAFGIVPFGETFSIVIADEFMMMVFGSRQDQD